MHVLWIISRGLTAAAAALVIGSAANAEPRNDGDAKIGIGMICDSQVQAARFVDLRAHGTDAQAAMAAVNKEADNPQACGLAAVAFTQGATLESTPIANKLVQVVRINIVAGFNGTGWQRVADTIQYAVIEGEGEAV